MKIEKFPLSDDYPSKEAFYDCQRVVDTANQTAKANRGDEYFEGAAYRHTMEELYFLYDLARGDYDPSGLKGYIFQAGMFCGVSACVMATALRERGSIVDVPVVAADVFRSAPWSSRHPEWSYIEARQNMLALNLQDWLCLVMYSDVLLAESPVISTGVRILVLDSDHSYKHVRRQLHVMTPFVADNGFLVIHDYYIMKMGVHQAVNEYFAEYDARPFWVYDFERPTDNTGNRFIVLKFNAPV